MQEITENQEYLEKQILTYLGNKRKLLKYIGIEVEKIQKELNADKMNILDLFSGSGIVARYLKQYSKCIYANDLESYSKIINECYLSNKSEFDEIKFNELFVKLYSAIKNNPDGVKDTDCIIRTNYSPKNDTDIQSGERVFYTNANATFIDLCRYYIEKIIPENYKKYFLAQLLIEASIHVNTSGVFKGFYKEKAKTPEEKGSERGRFGGDGQNALERIKGAIILENPIFSNFETEYKVYQEDANELAAKIKNIDIAYLDPPYNQHPYSSNYFMLNLILNNKMPDKISKVSGIPEDWNKSVYNKKDLALTSLEDIVCKLDAKYIIISYNNEGFISQDGMEKMLKKHGVLKTIPIEYNAFRGSRNLRERELKTTEFLFVLKKE